MEKLPTYNGKQGVNDGDDVPVLLTDLPFLTSCMGLMPLPKACCEVDKGRSDVLASDYLYRFSDIPDTDKLIQRFYRLGEIYALAYMHRLYTNHHSQIFEDIKDHLEGWKSIDDVWGEGDLHIAIDAFKCDDGNLPKHISIWIESGFFNALNRFLIMSILPKNSMMNPSVKLSKITADDINAMIEAVLHDKAPPNFPFQPFEGWAIGAQ